MELPFYLMRSFYYRRRMAFWAIPALIGGIFFFIRQLANIVGVWARYPALSPAFKERLGITSHHGVDEGSVREKLRSLTEKDLISAVSAEEEE